jgi:hypothetical protein
MSFIKIPPPCTSPGPGAGPFPLSTRLLVLMAVRRKKMLMTAIKNRNTAEIAVPTVPPISPTADHQLIPPLLLGGRTIKFIVNLDRDSYGDIDHYDNSGMTK